METAEEDAWSVGENLQQPQTTVMTHLEPREDPVSWDDRGLDRE